MSGDPDRTPARGAASSSSGPTAPASNADRYPAPKLSARLRTLFGGLLSFAAIALPGCSLLVPPTRIPVGQLQPDKGPCDGRAQTLIVMLPGIYSRPAEFVDEGFVAAVRNRGIAADVLIVDLHLGYYNDRSVLVRLRDDVVLPARAKGYKSIWLVGTSLGGFGALGYAVRHGDEIDGVVALAPFLARDRLMKELTDAGSAKAWRQVPHEREAEDLDREIWEWATSSPPPALPVYLGYGDKDRFIKTSSLFAETLPTGRSVEVPGGHDWKTWRTLWNGWLDRGLLPTACHATAVNETVGQAVGHLSNASVR